MADLDPMYLEPMAPDGRPWRKPRTWQGRRGPMGGAHRIAAILQLKAKERRELRDWLESGYRLRSPVDFAYDRVRMLAEGEQRHIVMRLHSTLQDGH